MLRLTNIRERFPAVLPEQAFIHTLRLERKRTERSLQSFLLMLVDVKTGLSYPNESVVCKIVRVLSPVTRETDTCGWHRQDAVLAIIFSDVPIRTREFVKEA